MTQLTETSDECNGIQIKYVIRILPTGQDELHFKVSSPLVINSKLMFLVEVKESNEREHME